MGRKGPKIFEKHQQHGGLYLLLRPFFFRKSAFFDVWNLNHATRMSTPRTFFRGSVFFVVLGFSWFLHPEACIGYWDCQKPKNLEENQQKQKNKGFSGMSGPRTLFRGMGLFVLYFIVVLVFFLVFGSGNFYRLLGLPKTKTNSRKKQKTKTQKLKQQKGFSGMSGPSTLFQALFFL